MMRQDDGVLGQDLTCPMRPKPARAFSCVSCKCSYTHKCDLIRHQKQVCGKEPMFKCKICDKKCFYKYALLSHIRHRHPETLHGITDSLCTGWQNIDSKWKICCLNTLMKYHFCIYSTSVFSLFPTWQVTIDSKHVYWFWRLYVYFLSNNPSIVLIKPPCSLKEFEIFRENKE